MSHNTCGGGFDRAAADRDRSGTKNMPSPALHAWNPRAGCPRGRVGEKLTAEPSAADAVTAAPLIIEH